MKNRKGLVFGAVLTALAFTIGAAEAAVDWTQRTMRDGNPSAVEIRPNVSCDGSSLVYVHSCRTNGCESTQQDGGSVYKVNLSTGTSPRIISSAIGGSERITYADTNENGGVIAFASNIDHAGDTPSEALGFAQVYVYIAGTNTFERLTAYQNEETLHPNVSCDGNVVCWTSLADPTSPELSEVSAGLAYCYNRTTDTFSAITTNTIKQTYWISPGDTGTKYVVSSLEPLAGSLPSGYETEPQIYSFNGTSWSRLGLLVAGDTRLPEPNLTGDESRVLFAMKGDLVEGPTEERRIAFQYEFASGLITRLFAPDPADPPLVTDYISANDDGDVIAVMSDANLDGGAATVGADVYSGIYTDSSQTVQSGSPVDLAITDSLGRTCDKNACAIPGCIYFEYDFNGDGEPNDRIWCDPRPAGQTDITVIPDGSAQPTDTYSLVSAVTGEPLVTLATSETIENIPPTPYEVAVPPPYLPFTLQSSRLQPRNGSFRLKGSFKTDPEGDISLALADGTNMLEADLGNIATYQGPANGRSLRSTVLVGTGTIKIRFQKRFRKGIFQNWVVSVVGSRISLAPFDGASDLTIDHRLGVGDGVLRKSTVMDRRSNGDLSYKQ